MERLRNGLWSACLRLFNKARLGFANVADVALGWQSKIGLEAGIKSTYDWFWQSGRINERNTVRL